MPCRNRTIAAMLTSTPRMKIFVFLEMNKLGERRASGGGAKHRPRDSGVYKEVAEFGRRTSRLRTQPNTTEQNRTEPNRTEQNHSQDAMDSWKSFLVVLCVIGCTCADVVKFLDCGSSAGTVSLVDITPCPSLPCKLKKGQDYSVNVTFTSGVGSQTSTAVVHGVIAKVPIPFPIPVSDGCQSGINCPIQAQQVYHYVASLPVKSEYPCLKVVVEWELRDDDKKDLFCIKFPVEIVN